MFVRKSLATAAIAAIMISSFPVVANEPVRLTDSQLDNVTAGFVVDLDARLSYEPWRANYRDLLRVAGSVLIEDLRTFGSRLLERGMINFAPAPPSDMWY